MPRRAGAGSSASSSASRPGLQGTDTRFIVTSLEGGPPPPIPGRSRARPNQFQGIHCAVERHGCQKLGWSAAAQSAMPSIAFLATLKRSEVER